jgi:hypothetical protein
MDHRWLSPILLGVAVAACAGSTDHPNGTATISGAHLGESFTYSIPITVLVQSVKVDATNQQLELLITGNVDELGIASGCPTLLVKKSLGGSDLQQTTYPADHPPWSWLSTNNRSVVDLCNVDWSWYGISGPLDIYSAGPERDLPPADYVSKIWAASHGRYSGTLSAHVLCSFDDQCPPDGFGFYSDITVVANW